MNKQLIRIREMCEAYKHAPTTQVLINPSLNEIRKLIVESVKNGKLYSQFKNDGEEDVRFVLTKDNYYFSDANEWTHTDMSKEFKISLSGDIVCGGMRSDGRLWFYKYMFLDFIGYQPHNRAFMPEEELYNLFKSTKFFQVIKPLVTDMRYA